MALYSDMNGFPESGFPVLVDVEDRLTLNTLHYSPIKHLGYKLDVVGNNRLLGALVLGGGISGATTIAMGGALSGVTSLGMNGALTGASTIGASGNVTLSGGNLLLTTGQIGSNIGLINKSWLKDLYVKNRPTCGDDDYIALLSDFAYLSSRQGRIGDESNNTTFESDGTIKFNGTATTWQDIDFPILIRTTGANIPTLKTIHGNITMPQWDVNDFNVCESQELVHQWKEESEIFWHLHLTTNGLDATDRYVRFTIEYGYVTPNGIWVWPANIDSGDVLIPANTPDRTMLIVNLGSFTPQAGTKIGGHCVARLKRITSTGAAPTTNPFVPMLQQHIQCDTVGSREISSK